MGTEREGIQVHSDEGESVPTDPQHLWSDFIDFFSPTCISKATDSLNTFLFQRRQNKTIAMKPSHCTLPFLPAAFVLVFIGP